jgi:starch synthase
VYVSREYASLAGAGGVKDVTEGLCKAAAARGIQAHVFLPFYRLIDGKKEGLKLTEGPSFRVAMNYTHVKRTEHVTIYSGSPQPNLTVHLVHARRYRYLMEGDGTAERHGIYQYTRAEAAALDRPQVEGKGYIDFFAMNVLLVKATLHALGLMDMRPDVIHCHDGHAALLPLIAQASEDDFAPYLRYVPTVVTVHNAGKGYHQEIADRGFAAAICGVPRDVVEGCLLDGSFDPFIAGGLFSSAINTVSENYARELQHTGQDWMTGWLGHVLAGYGIELLGVTNGFDVSGFDDVRSALDSKGTHKEDVIDFLRKGLEQPEILDNALLYGMIDRREDAPLLTFVGRLAQQKGYDILAEALGMLFEEDSDVQLLGLGDGNPNIVDQFRELAAKFAGRVCVAKGYSPSLADKIYAAGDFFVIPSRFEPCGLTDFVAPLMGNVPIVHRVGGLVKTLDSRFGFSYLGGAPELLGALRRALKVYREDKATLRKIQVDAVENIYDNFTWDKVLEKKYIPIYRDAMARMEPTLPY